MAFVQLSKISLAFGDRDILKNVNLVLANGTKAALTGANGCGKSTLMKIAAGLIQPDTGEISHEKDTVLAYLPQSGIVHRGKTLKSEAETAFADGGNKRYGKTKHACPNIPRFANQTRRFALA